MVWLWNFVFGLFGALALLLLGSNLPLDSDALFRSIFALSFAVFTLAKIFKSKNVFSKVVVADQAKAIKKVKYNATAHDPQAERIDGGGRCYPNCASDVWLRSCEHEVSRPIEGQTRGRIPEWLNGSLLRNGPGSWKVGDMTFQHLFDCSALLHRFAIRSGHVTYQNRFVRTETLKKNRAAQRIVVTEFGTASVPDPCHSIFDKVSAIFRPDSGSDNSMISIYPFGDEFYTFTETPIIHRINPRTLATEGRICVTDYAGVVNHTSHPHVMPDKTVYNLGMGTTKSGPVYNVICFPHGENMFEDAHVVGSIPCRWKLHPGYMHTFGVTENFFIIVEQPFSVSLPEFVKAQLYGQNLSACLKWFENKSTLFHVMERKSGKVVHTFRSESFFYLHIVNQYEQENHVVIDICCYKDPEMINCMYLESIVNMQSNPNYAAMFRGRPLRFVLPLGQPTTEPGNSDCRPVRRKLMKSFSLSAISSRLHQPKLKQSASQYEDITHMATNGQQQQHVSKEAGDDPQAKYESMVNLVTLAHSKAEAFQMPDKSVLVRPELLCDVGCETPRINYDNYLGKNYRYFYAISSDVDAENPGTLIKVDVVTKTTKSWCEPNCYPSEPIFVPSPNPSGVDMDEDDGVILASMVWGGLKDNHVGLLVLCARTWTELGRCEFHTKGPVPKCLHGWFAPNVL